MLGSGRESVHMSVRIIQSCMAVLVVGNWVTPQLWEIESHLSCGKFHGSASRHTSHHNQLKAHSIVSQYFRKHFREPFLAQDLLFIYISTPFCCIWQSIDQPHTSIQSLLADSEGQGHPLAFCMWLWCKQLGLLTIGGHLNFAPSCQINSLSSPTVKQRPVDNILKILGVAYLFTN